jgi:transcriptional regulator with XRE-family HTH domain
MNSLNLKYFRTKKAQITQKEMIRRLEKNGYTCTKSFLSRVENGKRKAPPELIMAFKKSFPNTLVDTIFYTDSAIAIKKISLGIDSDASQEYEQLVFDPGIRGKERNRLGRDEREMVTETIGEMIEETEQEKEKRGKDGGDDERK